MIEESDALKRILKATPFGTVETVGLSDALGRRTAKSVTGKVDLPGFDNSSMDGYAVRAADASEVGDRLRVSGEQPAGRVVEELELQAGEAIRIFTGAPIPPGVDAVVMQEDVRRIDDEIEIVEPVVAGEFIRRRGGDVCVGQRLFEPGHRLNAAAIGVLASQGIGKVDVYARPRVAVVSTGDELIAPESGVELEPGQIYNSNGAMLKALAQQFGAAEVRTFHAIDEAGALSQTLKEALEFGDMVLVAGGVSVGERDLVKGELAALGVESDFWKVRVKPGKPFLFGRGEGAFVFGLPGNPVSAFVTFLLFAAPAMERWQGASDEIGIPLTKISLPLASNLKNRGDRPHYIRVKIDTEGRFSPAGMQESHALFGLSRADALVRLNGEQDLAAGEIAAGYLLK